MTLFQRILTLLPLLACTAHAQFIVLKDGQRLAPAELKIADGKIMREKVVGGQKAQVSVNFGDIERLEWENPKQLTEARALMAAGKAKEGIAMLVEAREFFKPFKDIKGNPYADIVYAQVEALDAAGDFDNLIKVMPEVNSMTWDDARKLGLRIIKLNLDRRTSSDNARIIAEAQGLLKDTEESGVSAKLWMTIGDVHTKTEKWEEAFNAYLHVPVFYGSQAALVPQAELAAARSLVKMERNEDAAGMFQRIADSYPGSEVSESAKKERAVINGLKNKPDSFNKKAKAASDPKDAKAAPAK
jgi:tetratricopeptide (TPR) repeat protein